MCFDESVCEIPDWLVPAAKFGGVVSLWWLSREPAGIFLFLKIKWVILFVIWYTAFTETTTFLGFYGTYITRGPLFSPDYLLTSFLRNIVIFHDFMHFTYYTHIIYVSIRYFHNFLACSIFLSHESFLQALLWTNTFVAVSLLIFLAICCVIIPIISCYPKLKFIFIR